MGERETEKHDGKEEANRKVNGAGSPSLGRDSGRPG